MIKILPLEISAGGRIFLSTPLVVNYTKTNMKKACEFFIIHQENICPHRLSKALR